MRLWYIKIYRPLVQIWEVYPGSGFSFIPDPGSWISDPGSRNRIQQGEKRGGGIFFWSYFFVAINFTKVKIMDPDPAKWCRSDRIRIHDTGFNIQYILFLYIFECKKILEYFRYCIREISEPSPLISGSSWGAKKVLISSSALKVHKNEIFFGFDFEFCTISMLVMHK
jgi:hypothetical protein